MTGNATRAHLSYGSQAVSRTVLYRHRSRTHRAETPLVSDTSYCLRDGFVFAGLGGRDLDRRALMITAYSPDLSGPGI
jgi:hypothetical protein